MLRSDQIAAEETEDIWETEETKHSCTFFKDLMKMAECFRTIIEDIVEDGYGDYDIDKLLEIEDITRATVDMYDSGFLPSSFYSITAGHIDDSDPENPVETMEMVHTHNDDYFAAALGSFFTKNSKAQFNVYLELFDQKDQNGDLLICEDDRTILWNWMDVLIRNAIRHEHEIRKPVIIANNGEEFFTYKKKPEGSDLLIKYADMWSVDIAW